MKIFLFNPPSVNGVKMIREGRCMQRAGAWATIWPATSLATCAAVLEKAGHEVGLADCVAEEISEEKLEKILGDFKPELVIINTATPSIYYDLGMVNFVKKIVPIAKTAVIGLHVTCLPDESFSLVSKLDFVVVGEPEMTIAKLANILDEKKQSFDKILGLSFKKNGKIIHNPKRPFIKDLDNLPFPAWNLMDPACYKLPFTGESFLSIAPARGCPYSCIFCAAKPYYGGKFRLRSPESVVDEIEYDLNNFNIKQFFMYTELFTLNHDFASKFCEEVLKRKLKIGWVCNSRVDTVTLSLLKKFKEAGCWMISYGVESADEEILKRAKKGITQEQIKNAFQWARQAGIETVAHVIFGLPVETEEKARKTIDFILKLPVDYGQFYCAVPFPGCEFYEEAKENHWLENMDWSLYEQNYSVVKMGNLTPEKVMALRNEAFRRFYLRPKVILKTLLKIRSFQGLKDSFSLLKDFLNWA